VAALVAVAIRHSHDNPLSPKHSPAAAALQGSTCERTLPAEHPRRCHPGAAFHDVPYLRLIVAGVNAVLNGERERYRVRDVYQATGVRVRWCA
jgi:hypothetical protein